MDKPLTLLEIDLLKVIHKKNPYIEWDTLNELYSMTYSIDGTISILKSYRILLQRNKNYTLDQAIRMLINE